jgi:molybdopterin biosynthesis enzyme MoaB
MRRIDALRTLALSSALILALGGTGCANEEDTSDTGEPLSAETSEAEEE